MAREEKLSMAEITAKLRKKYGAGAVKIASEARAVASWRRIPTGIFAFDYLAGGGLPHGAVTLLYGLESGGKTYVSLRAISGTQRICRDHVVPMVRTGKTLPRCPECGNGVSPTKDGKCSACGAQMMGTREELICPECRKYKPMKTLLIDAEKSFKAKWAADAGCDCALITLIQPESAEEAMDSSMLLLETGEFDFMVLDTIAQLTPNVELEESAEKWQQGYLARLMNKALRGWMSRMNSTGADELRRMTILLINQIRYKIGVFYGDPTTRPGGKGQDFAATLSIKMWPGKTLKDTDGNALGAILRLSCEKNKSAPTRDMEGNFRLWFRDCVIDEVPHKAGETDEFKVVMEYAHRFGVIEYDEKKGTYTLAGKAHGSRKQVEEAVRSDTGLYEKMRETLLGMQLGEVWYSLSELDKARKKMGT
jgi:RecA/RadA recombinase